MSWDPALYLRFTTERSRPAIDLLRAIEADPARVVDLGCGTGGITAALSARWPDADVRGLDNSEAMLATARRQHPQICFESGDISVWTPDESLDLIYSNAALHWLDHHEELFPRLIAGLAPGGVLAVQMPHNQAQFAYRLVDELGRTDRWIDRLGPVLRPFPVSNPPFYYDLLRPLVAHLDIWETEYLHALAGDNPVATWLSGSFLRPVLAALGDAAEPFQAAWAARVAAAYPPRPDGTTLFPFRRLFIIARR